MGILDKLPFQIMGWHGPNYDKFNATTIGHLADAGFTATYARLQRDQAIRALDMAREAGMRLVIWPPDLPLYHTPNAVDEAWLRRFRDFILSVPPAAMA